MSSRSHLYQVRRDEAGALINSTAGLSVGVPGGAFYLFVNCQTVLNTTAPNAKRIETDADLALYLLESAGVAVAPGSGFGTPGYFRITTATSLEV